MSKASMPAMALNRKTLPSMTGFAARGADVAQAENGRAVADYGNQVAASRVIVAAGGVGGYGERRRRYAGRVGQRQGRIVLHGVWWGVSRSSRCPSVVIPESLGGLNCSLVMILCR